MEFNRDNPFVTGFLVSYLEGDMSLERVPIEYVPSPNDRLHPITNWDTLSDLSFDYWGTSKLWWVIADVNKIHDPFNLTPNTNLIIPDIDPILAQL